MTLDSDTTEHKARLCPLLYDFEQVMYVSRILLMLRVAVRFAPHTVVLRLK